jgi:ABC-type bacteriocin/lantibiotic exporter with double-glycine peptidase domain
LSVGQAAARAIARACSKTRAYLVLDDATSSVVHRNGRADSAGIERPDSGARRPSSSPTPASSDGDERRDLILVLDKGRVIQAGTHAELLRQEGLYLRHLRHPIAIDREEIVEEVSDAVEEELADEF